MSVCHFGSTGCDLMTDGVEEFVPRLLTFDHAVAFQDGENVTQVDAARVEATPA